MAAVGKAAETRAADYARTLQESGLRYRIAATGFATSRFSAKISDYLTDGYRHLAKAVEGRRHAALFSATSQGGDVKIILSPALPKRRLWLAFH